MAHSIRNTLKGLAIASWATLTVVAPALAQETLVDAEEIEANDRPMLEEIVVTAQKRSENIRDVPISITAISGEALKEKNIENLNDLSRLTPNTKIQAMPTLSTVYIRGLGTPFNKGFEQSVGTFFDGIFYGRMAYLSDGMLDLERVEILRGPQGTLFGKNTIAGAINITTGTPAHEWLGDLQVQFGEFQHKRFQGFLNIPIWEDKVALRLSGARNDRDGYIKNTTLGIDEWNTDTWNWRAKLLVEVMSDLDVTFSVSGATVDQIGQGAQISHWTDDVALFFQSFDPQAEDDISNYQMALDGDSGASRNTLTATMHINWDIADHTLTLISGFTGYSEDTDWDADIGPVPLLEAIWDEDYSQLSQEIRLLSPPGRLEYTLGLYYFENEVDSVSEFYFAPVDDPLSFLTGALLPDALGTVLGPIIGSLPQPDLLLETQNNLFFQESQSYAAFGQLTFFVTEELALIAGARISHEQKDINFRHYHTNAGVENPGILFPALTGSESFDLNKTRKETNFSPKASIRYDLMDEVTVYATYAEGYKGGGFSEQAVRQEQAEFEEENSATYEAGLKSRFLGGAATFNLGYFYTNFDNLQVSVFNGTQFVVGNAAEATTQGIEFDAAFVPFWGMFITLAGGWTDASYDSFVNGPCIAGEEEPCDLTGQQLANAPEWNGALGLNYVNGLGNLPFDFYIGADLLYQSTIFFGTDLDPLDSQGATTTINARVGLRDDDERWSFVVFVRNVTDELNLVTSADAPLFEGTHFAAAELPRTIDVEFRLSF